MWAAYLICFGLSCTLSLVLTALMLRVAPKLGLVDRPSHRKIHLAPVPLGGGIAMALSIIVTLCVGGGAVLALRATPGLFAMPEDFTIHIPGLAARLAKRSPVLAGAAILAVMGIIDDKRGLSAWHKLAVQILVGLLLAASGFTVSLFIQVRAVSWLLTVLWIVFVTNAFNLLDNMDGLAAGISAIAAATSGASPSAFAYSRPTTP